jgi:Flp pilus assembly pilin Flp
MAFFRWVDRSPARGGEEAQTLAEYAVILGVITPAIVIAFTLLSGNIRQLFDNITAFFGG